MENPARDILLVAATAMELRAALALLPVSGAPLDAAVRDSTATDDSAGRVSGPLARCEISGRGVRLLVCGIGPVNAAFSLGRALERGAQSGREDSSPGASFGGILNVGIAGTYDAAAAPPGSVVWADSECWPEYGLRNGESVDARGIGFAQAPEVFDRLTLDGFFVDEKGDTQNALGIMGLSWHNFHLRGGGVTVAGVSGSPQTAARLALATGGFVENMEGFALALGAFRAKVPFAELRAVSNLAGVRPPQGWDIPGALAALGKAVAELFDGHSISRV